MSWFVARTLFVLVKKKFLRLFLCFRVAFIRKVVILITNYTQ